MAQEHRQNQEQGRHFDKSSERIKVMLVDLFIWSKGLIKKTLRAWFYWGKKCA